MESFPNVETLALACAELERASGTHHDALLHAQLLFSHYTRAFSPVLFTEGEEYFSPIQELRSLTNLKHLDISYVAYVVGVFC